MMNSAEELREDELDTARLGDMLRYERTLFLKNSCCAFLIYSNDRYGRACAASGRDLKGEKLMSKMKGRYGQAKTMSPEELEKVQVYATEWRISY